MNRNVITKRHLLDPAGEEPIDASRAKCLAAAWEMPCDTWSCFGEFDAHERLPRDAATRIRKPDIGAGNRDALVVPTGR